MLLEKQSEIFTSKVSRLVETKCLKGRYAAVFQLRTDVLGGKNIAVEPSLMTDPQSNQLVSSADEIKRVSLTYCTNLLTNRPAKEDYKEDFTSRRAYG